ncbi:MAG: carotenoid biosynthesis protein [Candidatus Moraniibacteriota bacterium]
MDIFLLIFELAAFAAFGALLFLEWRKRDSFKIMELFAGGVFGMLLEIGNIAMSDSYHYSEDFLISMGGVPIAIGLGWSVIIFSAMRISDSYAVRERNRIWMDGLCVLILDLAIDAVAIRLGFWGWTINYNQEWFGVPYENLIAWIFVGVSFSLVMRFLKKQEKSTKKFAFLAFLSPFTAYGILLIFLLALGIFLRAVYFFAVQSQSGSVGLIPPLEELYHEKVALIKGYLLFLMTVILVVYWGLCWKKSEGKFKNGFEILPFVFFIGIHFYFLTVLLATGWASELPTLLWIGIFSFALHLVYHLLPFVEKKRVSKEVPIENDRLE